MILSVSRRTDIPCYYSDWFVNRIKAGYLCVRNPFNSEQISRISLSPDVIDCIVFWTKNPADMLDKLDELKDYEYYFQFTLTGYGKDAEPNLPDKKSVIVPTFRKLSERIGKKRVVWRYDPIMFNDKYTPDYHIRAFGELCSLLDGYTERVVISFVDLYAKTKKNTESLHLKSASERDMMSLAAELSRIARAHGLEIFTCAENIELSSVGIEHGSCVDKRLVEELTGFTLKCAKDKNQRGECGCFESIDVGAYNTCRSGCKYCYANFSDALVGRHVAEYDPTSPVLCGRIGDGDEVTERKISSFRERQMSFLE